MRAKERWFGWHFLPDDGKLRWNSDGKPVRLRKVYRVEGELILCENGLHASKRAIDALQYAPGALVSWVELRGEIEESEDKACVRERIHLKMADATRTLHLFAIDEAKRALKLTKVEDKRCWDALEVKRKWLDGKASLIELNAVREAARGAAWKAARGAAWKAAREAAWKAAREAAWKAAWKAAWDAAREAQNKRLEQELKKLLEMED